MSNAPVCHIPVDQTITDQPRPARFPTVPAAVDLKSALVAINALRLIIQQLTGQLEGSLNPGEFGLAGLQGAAGVQGAKGAQGQKGKDGKTPKTGRFVEDKSQRVEKEFKVYQDNDPTSDNWVKIKRINKVVWKDRVTGELIVWTR